jgi:thiosulfate dehydrogenase [quinone] large subunit
MSATRRSVSVLGAIAAVVLLWMENPWFRPEDVSPDLRTATTVAFWLLFIAVVVLMFQDRKNVASSDEVQIEGPAFTRYLFSNKAAGLFWLPIRLFLGFSWVDAGWHKLTGGGWITDGGSALAGYWTNAVKVPEAGAGRPPISFEWYRDFVNVLLDGHHEAWFAWLVAFGELAVGLGLLAGALVGIAAFFGALMNMSFLLAGSASTNPVLFTMAIGLMLAWKVAGYYGLDRYLLPKLGTPWRSGVDPGGSRTVAPDPAGG